MASARTLPLLLLCAGGALARWDVMYTWRTEARPPGLSAEQLYEAAHGLQGADDAGAAARYRWALELSPRLFAAHINLGNSKCSRSLCVFFRGSKQRLHSSGQPRPARGGGAPLPRGARGGAARAAGSVEPGQHAQPAVAAHAGGGGAEHRGAARPVALAGFIEPGQHHVRDGPALAGRGAVHGALRPAPAEPVVPVQARLPAARQRRAPRRGGAGRGVPRGECSNGRLGLPRL